MKLALRILCAAALALTIGPALLYYLGNLAEPALKNLMLAGTILWFVAATTLDRLNSRS